MSGEYIFCQACGEGGGTLVKVGEGEYRHKLCAFAREQRRESGPYSVNRGRRRLITLAFRRAERKEARDE